MEELLGSRKQGEGRFSFEELLKAVFREVKEACSMAFHGIWDSLFSELSAGAGQMAKILLIALTGAVFTCFSDVFPGGQIFGNGLLRYLSAFIFFAGIQLL